MIFPLYIPPMSLKRASPLSQVSCCSSRSASRTWWRVRSAWRTGRSDGVQFNLTKKHVDYMEVCQNLVPLVKIKIAGKWMFIPLKMVLIGIDPYPHECFFQHSSSHTTVRALLLQLPAEATWTAENCWARASTNESSKKFVNRDHHGVPLNWIQTRYYYSWPLPNKQSIKANHPISKGMRAFRATLSCSHRLGWSGNMV
jgi:hypothetical protein